MVCGCSSPMNCSSVCESTFLMKPNGIASIVCCRLPISSAASRPSASLINSLASLEPAGAGVQRTGLAGQEFGDHDFLVVAADRVDLSDHDADRFDVAWRKLAENPAPRSWSACSSAGWLPFEAPFHPAGQSFPTSSFHPRSANKSTMGGESALAIHRPQLAPTSGDGLRFPVVPAGGWYPMWTPFGDRRGFSVVGLTRVSPLALLEGGVCSLNSERSIRTFQAKATQLSFELRKTITDRDLPRNGLGRTDEQGQRQEQSQDPQGDEEAIPTLRQRQGHASRQRNQPSGSGDFQ